jgi:diacylglycerol kinase family enzyme
MWATEVRIANGRYHGGLELIESADLKSGEIVVQVVPGRSVLKLGWSYVAAAAKLSTRRQAVREFVAREFTLSTRPSMKVSIDGEVAAETPVKISAIPDAVTIAAPRGS